MEPALGASDAEGAPGVACQQQHCLRCSGEVSIQPCVHAAAWCPSGFMSVSILCTVDILCLFMCADWQSLTVQGINAVTAAAMGGQMPAGGGATGQLSEVLAELQSLPRNGQFRAPGTVGPKPLHRSSPGKPVQAQPLQVGKV